MIVIVCPVNEEIVAYSADNVLAAIVPLENEENRPHSPSSDDTLAVDPINVVNISDVPERVTTDNDDFTSREEWIVWVRSSAFDPKIVLVIIELPFNEDTYIDVVEIIGTDNEDKTDNDDWTNISRPSKWPVCIELTVRLDPIRLVK